MYKKSSFWINTSQIFKMASCSSMQDCSEADMDSLMTEDEWETLRLDSTDVPLSGLAETRFFTQLLCRAVLRVNRAAFMGSNRNSVRATLFLLSLIVLAGDIHPNPGPPVNWKYPCGKCNRPVRFNHSGIMCEVCYA